eukprot:2062354-Amphidinium_carterae.2
MLPTALHCGDRVNWRLGGIVGARCEHSNLECARIDWKMFATLTLMGQEQRFWVASQESQNRLRASSVEPLRADAREFPVCLAYTLPWKMLAPQ